MHKKLEIPKNILDRVIQKRGEAHIHRNFVPQKTALLAIDLQNGFLNEDYAYAYVPGGVSVVPNVNRISGALRKAGGKVFWVRNTITEQSLAEWSSWFSMTNHKPEEASARRANMHPGAFGHELHPDLDYQAEDETVLKTRFSAFIQGSSDLDQRLRAFGIDTLIIAGAVTNICCESTARDAMMLNYKTIMVEDANAALSDEEHHASLLSFFAQFGDVLTTQELVSLSEKNKEIFDQI